jgi:hypothetical protein
MKIFSLMIIQKIVISLTAIGSTTIVPGIFSVDSTLRTGYAEIKNIREDQQKVAYLNNWVW